MTAELKGIHAKTFQDLDVIKDVLKLDEEKIVELEKENAELEQKLEQTEKDLADYQFNYPTIKKLQKENTELKKDNEGYEKDNARLVQQYNDLQKENAELKGLKDVATLIRANNDTVITLMQLNNMLVSKNQQLTNAKEIIREYINLDYIQLSPCDKVIDLRDKAEQFLKDN